jgi:hypothetical protein
LASSEAASQGSTISEENKMNEVDSESKEKIDREIVREDQKVLTPEERFRIALAKHQSKKNS